MPKAVKNFTWEGNWYLVGDDVPDEVAAEVSENLYTDRDEKVDLADLPYDKWNNDELRTECANRELPTSGKKSELVDRLTEDDKAHA